MKGGFEKEAPGGAGTRGTAAPAGRPALGRPHPRCPLRVAEAQHHRAGGAAGIVWLSRHRTHAHATKRQAYPDRQCDGALCLREEGWTICLPPSSTSSMSISLSAPSILKRPLFVPAAAHPGHADRTCAVSARFRIGMTMSNAPSGTRTKYLPSPAYAGLTRTNAARNTGVSHPALQMFYTYAAA